MTRAAPAEFARPAPAPLLPRLRALLAARLGLQFDDRQDDRLATALTRVAGAAGPERFLDHMELAPTRAGLDALAAELTVGETFFFRHPEQFDALRVDLLPSLTRGPTATGRLRVLSAGCASGEEAYTLAVTLQRAGLQAQGIAWDVLAVDVNPAALARAAAARYGEWSLRATPPEQRDLWFQQTGPAEWTPIPAIRERVRFERRQLGAPDAVFWAPDSFDVIFCRNVLMYLEPAALQQAIRHLTGALAPGGVLFLGHAETLRGSAQARAAGLALRQAHGCFFYRREAEDTPLAWPFPWAPPPPAAAATLPPPAPLPPVVDAARPGSEAEQALLDEALLLIEAGQLDDGLRACARLAGPRTPATLQAEVLFLQGLAMEERGQLPAAEWHHQRAAAKDAAFALPHLRLGLLARRRGEIVAARRELQRALTLLEGESPERLRRFGGGFERDDLRRLCLEEIQEVRT